MTLMRFEPATPRSRVKHSTTALPATHDWRLTDLVEVAICLLCHSGRTNYSISSLVCSEKYVFYITWCAFSISLDFDSTIDYPTHFRFSRRISF